MLIIFDLDDTLIDTSGSVTPFKLRQCLEVLMSLGVSLPPLDEAYAEVLLWNQRCSKSQEALSSFASSYGASASQIQESLKCLSSSLPDSFQVSMTPHAKEILEFYHQKYPLAIVTGGHPPFQRDKLKKAGIDSSLFSMIGIPEDSIKKPYYQALQEKFSLHPQEIWMCGDRIEMDLKPAFELGFRTIHMRWGRGAMVKPEPWVDYSIGSLSELKGIIK